MAEKQNGKGRHITEGEVSAAHEVSNRNAVIAECGQAMRSIQEQRKELNEQAGEIRERLRGISLEPKAFMEALRRADMEQQAQDAYMDAFRESFNVLAGGGQLDWISALDKSGDNPNPTDHEVTEPEAA